MAKAKTTRKWIAQNYTCVSVGYCGLQYLLKFQSPRFYTCGVYGWNCDVYAFGDWAITTGYRGMVSHVDGLGWDKTREYDKKAAALIAEGDFNEWDKTKDAVNGLLKEYLAEVFGTDAVKRFVY